VRKQVRVARRRILVDNLVNDETADEITSIPGGAASKNGTLPKLQGEFQNQRARASAKVLQQVLPPARVRGAEVDPASR